MSNKSLLAAWPPEITFEEYNILESPALKMEVASFFSEVDFPSESIAIDDERLKLWGEFYDAYVQMTADKNLLSAMILRHGDLIVGVCLVEPNYLETEIEKRQLTIRNLTIHPDYRGQSLGKTLLEKAERFLISRGMNRSEILAIDQLEADQFLTGQGYERTARLGPYRECPEASIFTKAIYPD